MASFGTASRTRLGSCFNLCSFHSTRKRTDLSRYCPTRIVIRDHFFLSTKRLKRFVFSDREQNLTCGSGQGFLFEKEFLNESNLLQFAHKQLHVSSSIFVKFILLFSIPFRSSSLRPGRRIAPGWHTGASTSCTKLKTRR